MNKVMVLVSGLVLISISIPLIKDVSAGYWAVIALGIAMTIGSLTEKHLNWFK